MQKTKDPLVKSRFKRKVEAYIALTKPRVIELLLVTTVPAMILAAQGWPGTWLILGTLLGGAASAGAANTLNCYLDRDIDQVMDRTKRRPLVTGEVSPRGALIFGFSLIVFSTLWFALLINVVSALLSLGAIVIYVVGYTMILKRRTAQNIVWGGTAGCMPVFIGWAAVTGGLSWAALLLFLIIFFWTPPHYWPLSIKFKNDYSRANVPMLPVVATNRRVAIEMLIYTIAMVVCSLLLIPVGDLGIVYSVSALVLGIWFFGACWGLYKRAKEQKANKLKAMVVFHGSITYLTLLFVALAVDVFLPW